MDQRSAESAYRTEAGRRWLRWWGGLFRATFIAAIGIGGYALVDPAPIADQPLATLTLRDLAGNIFAWGLALGCVSWFFHFPTDSEYDDGLSYEDWGKFGGYVALGIVLVTWFAVGNS